jgi:Ca2+-binding RTX toxin-like protein
MAVFNGSSLNDILNGTQANDIIIAGAGTDYVFGSDGNDNIAGGEGGDFLFGGNGNDVIGGDDGNGSTSTVPVTTSNSITVPSTGQTLAVNMTVDDASNATSLRVTGVVSRSAVQQSQVNVAFVIDVSGSMSGPFGGATVPDLNGNGSANELLDGAIQGYEALLASIIGPSNLPNARIGLIPFESTSNIRLVAPASRDSNGNGLTDIVESLRGLRDLGGTDYEAGLQQAVAFFNGSPAGSNFVFFLSDGVPNTTVGFADEVATLRGAGINATIRAIGLGSGSSLPALDLVDDGLANNTAQQVLTPATLNAGLTGSSVQQAEIARVEVLVNGVIAATLPPSSLVATPFGLSYDVTVPGLSATASDTITVRVVASDPAATSVSTSQVVEQAAGSGGDDRIFGEDGNDYLQGFGGNDIIDGGNGNDNLVGDDGDDLLVAGSGDDALAGGAGNDTLYAGYDDDEAYGFGGDDLIVGDAGDDKLFGNDGNDRIDGGAGNDQMKGGDGIDVIFDLSGDNLMEGENGNDALYGGIDTDIMIGGAGIDYADGGAGNDFLQGNEGNDTLFGNVGDDVISGGADDDLMIGWDGNDQLYGELGADYMDGGLGDDNMQGGDGNDTLYAGFGADLLVGGRGSDVLGGQQGGDNFIFYAADMQNGAVDYVVDFLNYTNGDYDFVTFAGITREQIVFSNVGVDCVATITFSGGTQQVVFQNSTVAAVTDQVFYV